MPHALFRRSGRMADAELGERGSRAFGFRAFVVLRVDADFEVQGLLGPGGIQLEDVFGLRGAVDGDAEDAIRELDLIVEILVQTDIGEGQLEVLALDGLVLHQGFHTAFEELQFDEGIGFAGVAVDLADDDFLLTGDLDHATGHIERVRALGGPADVVVGRVDHLAQFGAGVLGVLRDGTHHGRPEDERTVSIRIEEAGMHVSPGEFLRRDFMAFSLDGALGVHRQGELPVTEVEVLGGRAGLVGGVDQRGEKAGEEDEAGFHAGRLVMVGRTRTRFGDGSF